MSTPLVKCKMINESSKSAQISSGSYPDQVTVRKLLLLYSFSSEQFLPETRTSFKKLKNKVSQQFSEQFCQFALPKSNKWDGLFSIWRQILNLPTPAARTKTSTREMATPSTASATFSRRVLVAVLVCSLLLDLSSFTEARPQDDPASVAEAIRLLQEFETKHAQHARPR
ncbi:uncharacterized protein LOC131693575 [Topomyia yanbarensis]|uniref:uncharacterized protein LOC131693575 n=1 Tax=Topomyia yanbarensis TaxID=2498891 RepID=UPI00273A9DAC|nr:uncharacterized protein LOC131693575 [Topomyia yanbarensis]